MRRLPVIGGVALSLVLASAAMANPVNVYFVQGPQDPVGFDGRYDELGSGVFPADELISTQYVGTTPNTSCAQGPGDNPNVPNQVVSMTNLTNRSFYEPWYVADPETTITNYDGWAGNAGLGDAQFAFMIDNMGVNTPLISGDVNGNFAFDPNETWTFILQDWATTTAAAAANSADFDSLGIASLSTAWPPSTGSIIAIPEPATIALLALGTLALVRRRSR